MILGKLYRDKLSRSAPSIKLSQLIEAYYKGGVLEERIKACHRRELFKEFAPQDEMKEQSEAFAILLNKEVRLSFSYNEDAVADLVDGATKSLEEYIRK